MTRTVHSSILSSQAARAPSIDEAKDQSVMPSPASHQQSAGWLVRNGPRELELLLRAILRYPSEPILIADDDRHYLDASFGAGKLLGLSRDKIIGRRIDDFVEPSFRPRIEQLWQAFLEQGEQEGTCPLVGPDGSVREVGYTAKGNVLPVRHLLVLHDKTKKKHQAAAVGADEDQVPSWVKDYALFLLDADGRVVTWYSGAERIYGYKDEEIIGQHVACLDPSEDSLHVKLQGEWKRVAAEGHFGKEGWHKRKDGSRFWANVLTMTLKDENGELQGFARVVRDFSKRHLTEETLRESSGRLRQSPAESNIVGIVSGEFDRVTEASDEFLRMVGYSRADLAAGQLHWPDITPPEHLPLDERAHEEGLRYGACTPFEKEYIRKDGTRVRVLVAGAVLNLSPFKWIAFVQDLTERDRAEKIEGELGVAHNFDEIVGKSAALKRVLAQVGIVAPTDATVLILGETGTGKELAARAIHRISARRERPFITLNCAAIPTGLLESELFGYERGAFTGALSQKIGRFELAHRGTLFLDEVGDIPLDLQPKLLRALQEKEFERLGGTRTIPIDVRLLAATNRNLTQMMGDKLFRSDLYYRLKVFPITIPPLRDHPEDIPILARYFVQKYAGQMNKRIETIPSETMRALVSWPWPGNVRELENFIERAVILSRGPNLRAPLAEIRAGAVEAASSMTLEQVEREHILRVLRETGGVVSTTATRLGLPRTTLNAMMRKLGISRKDL
ncbi:MAG TPA: sigma 54-interacting transcriptional regulator [Bryobacterales bacterium]|nr:sigma 54-interacting transcriptional regulator [Bryobacterales bacterium]